MNSQNNAQLIKLAEHYFRSGNYPFAQNLLKQILDSNPADSKANELAAYIAGNAGNIELAHKLLHKACQQPDCSPEAVYYLGTSHLRNAQFHDSIECFKKSIKETGYFFEVTHDLGLAYFHIQKYSESIDFFNKALEIKPNSFEALTNLGNSLKASNRYEDALLYQNKAINIDPQNVEGWLNKGAILNELKRYEEALIQYDHAIQLQPNYLEAWSNKGNTLHALERYDEALIHHDQAIFLNNLDAGAWYNKGVTLHELKRYEEALVQYGHAIQLKPTYLEAWSNKGNTLCALAQYDEALAYYDQAIFLNNLDAGAWHNKGVALHELRRYNEALAHYEQAIQLKPTYLEAWSSKGHTLYALARYDEALAHYNQAYQLEPDLDFLLGNLIHVRMLISDWSDFKNEISALANKINDHKKVSVPFYLLSVMDSPNLHLLAARTWSDNKYPSNSSLPQIAKYQNKKIRIGYFSADFKSHPVSYLTAELFELHDRNSFEVFAFSLKSAHDNDPMKARLGKAFDQFIDVQSLSDLEIAKLARKLQIDIAIDLGGHTKDARTGIFSYRAAPIQVNYLGYPGSLGSEYMDYLIGDKTIIPMSSQQYYSEKIAYLPNTYMVDDSKRVAVQTHLEKSKFNLPDTGFIFCCFNNSYKITPDTFQSWMRILEKVENSVLWLMFFSEII
jgi:protein O-GlcNAc transferase